MLDDNKKQLAIFKKQLIALQLSLIDDNKKAKSATETVELDQSAVGRLSRMDAMQVQAMAQENTRRRDAKLVQIDAALNRINNNDYGYCNLCDEEIALKRLAFDPTTVLCIDCANREE